MTWPRVALDDVFAIARGGSPRPIDDYITDDPNGLNWIMIADAPEGAKYIEKTKKRIRPEGAKRSRIVKPGDFLLSNSMSFGRPYIMKTSGCIHDGWLVLSPRRQDVDPDFLFRFLGSAPAYAEFERRASGVTVKNLNIDAVAGVQIPLPPLGEQRRIADILDRADAIRTKRREAIVQLDALRKAVYRDVIEAGGPSRRLADCVDAIQIGPFGSLLHETDYIAGGVPLVNPKHIRDGQIVPAAETVAPERLRDLGLYRLRTGDVVLGRRGEMGRCAIVTDKEDGWVCGTGSMFVRPKEGVTNAYFVAAALSSPSGRAWLESSALGITLLNLNKGIVSDFPVRLAPFRLQQELERQVRAVDSLKAAHRASLAEMDALFVSLQHRAFRGEL